MSLSAPAGCTWTEATERLDAFLVRTLSARRYGHSRAVAELSAHLAVRFGCDEAAAYFTGLGHDAAREMPKPGLLAEVTRGAVEVSPYELEHPVLLHAPVCALLLGKMFPGIPAEIPEAVRRHTLGSPDLSLLGKILFVADYCEPGRKYIDDAFREAVFCLPLDGMLVYIVENERARGHEPSPLTRSMTERLKSNLFKETR